MYVLVKCPECGSVDSWKKLHGNAMYRCANCQFETEHWARKASYREVDIMDALDNLEENIAQINKMLKG